jgi:hypothetical protein
LPGRLQGRYVSYSQDAGPVNFKVGSAFSLAAIRARSRLDLVPELVMAEARPCVDAAIR